MGNNIINISQESNITTRPTTSETGDNNTISTTNYNNNSIFMSNLQKIIDRPCKQYKKPIFKLESNEKSASFNSKLLKSMNYDFEQTIKGQGLTPLLPGSEFRDTTILDPLLNQYNRWDKMKEIISQGASYPMKPQQNLSDTTIKNDLLGAIKQGNNKSASNSQEDKDFIAKNYQKEVMKGWMIPFLKEDIVKIKDAGAIPIGINKQFTIDEKGNQILEIRLTHDASRPRI